MKPNSIIMFHDSALVYKALRLIQLYMRKSGVPFRFFKKSNSAMSAILLGDFKELDLTKEFGVMDDLEEFYSAAETGLIQSLVENRVQVQFTCVLTPVKTARAL